MKDQERIAFKEENQSGLYAKYLIKKIVKVVRLKDDFFGTPQFRIITKPVEDNAEYFVLRLDMNGDDMNHIAACRQAIHTYSAHIESTIPDLAKDLRERYPLIEPNK